MYQRVSLKMGREERGKSYFWTVFHPTCHQLCKHFGTGESIYQRKECESRSTDLTHWHGCPFYSVSDRYFRSHLCGLKGRGTGSQHRHSAFLRGRPLGKSRVGQGKGKLRFSLQKDHTRQAGDGRERHLTAESRFSASRRTWKGFEIVLSHVRPDSPNTCFALRK